MIDKAKLHHWLVVVRKLKVWQLVILLIMMTFVSAYLLRQNNLGMIERRDIVKQADKENKDVQKRLLELQHYVSNHMNASLGDKGIYLDASYQRAYDAAIEAAAKATNPNSAVYTQASIDCRSRFAGGRESFRNDYVRCVIERVGSLSSAQDPMAGLKPPPVDLYRHNFISPLWSFDPAGISVLVTGVILLVIVAKIVFTQVVIFILKRRRA